jgi:excisionase family DNA binding protein
LQGDESVTNPATSLHTDTSPQSSDPQPFAGFSKDFATHLLPNSAGTSARGGAPGAAEEQGAELAQKTRPRPSSAPTLADLRVLWGGRDRLLKVAKVAEQLAVGAWRIYQLCEDGELPHVRINNSIRVRPKDLEEFIASKVTTAETPPGPAKWTG